MPSWPPSLTQKGDLVRLTAEIIGNVRKLVNAPGYSAGQIDELRMLVAEYDAISNPSRSK
jgi:hypothetical protein